MDIDTQQYALEREEGQAVRFLRALLMVKATEEQTGGALGLIDHVLPTGWASPHHAHRNLEESFYVLEGGMTLYEQAAIEAQDVLSQADEALVMG
jgi:uncharacterized cupin superfamily protein